MKGGDKIWFGLGYPTKLPKGWTLKESADDFAIGIAPTKRGYYLSLNKALPIRRCLVARGLLKRGDYYADFEKGVICFEQEETK